jgi:hypothetical protein
MAEDNVQIYDFTTAHKRGDTFLARDFLSAQQPLGTPKAIAAARMQIRTEDGALVAEFATDATPPTATITGAGDNVVTLGEKAATVTAEWPEGDHLYDLEVNWLEDGPNRTILKGTFPVSADVTIPG